jgi:inorganic triphosphatase YgiF
MAEGELLATLKTLGTIQGAVHRREEIELPIPEGSDPWDPWPEPIAERIRTVTDPRALRGTFELVITRTSFEIREGDRAVAVASFDAVAARKPKSERSAHWNELEVEVAGDAGDAAALLERAADALARLLPLVPSQQTKLERAQAVLLLGAALDPDGDGA